MKQGHFIHRHILLDSLEETAKQLGFNTFREFNNIDLLIENNETRIAIECELTSKRIEKDWKRASDNNVVHLLILVTNYEVAKAVKRKLTRLQIKPKQHKPPISILVLPQAIIMITAISKRLN